LGCEGTKPYCNHALGVAARSEAKPSPAKNPIPGACELIPREAPQQPWRQHFSC
jgi:hypothetical protein